MRITLIRHAESQANIREDLIGGYQPNIPLTKKWIHQAKLLGERLYKEGYLRTTDGGVHFSPAVRTKETKRIALEILWDHRIAENSELRIRELGQWDWENKKRVEIYTTEMQKILNDSAWSYRPPNGESQIDVGNRMLEWLNSLPKNAHSLAFSHGMAINCLVQRLIWLPSWTAHHHELSNTGITELKYKNHWWSLIRYNDHSHL